MKIDNEYIGYIQTVVKTAKLVGIDSVIIEPGLVRAIDDAKTVVVWSNKNVPDMPFGSIGLNRIGEFSARYDVARACDDFSIEAIVDDKSQFTKSLVMKGKGIKIDYRCANPTTIPAPKQLNDKLKARVQLNPEAVVFLQKGQSAMGSEQVTFISNDKVSFELVDVNNDVFSYVIANEAQPLTDEADTKFVHRYPAKIVLALFRQNPQGFFDIGQKGILSFPLNGLTVFVLPQV